VASISSSALFSYLSRSTRALSCSMAFCVFGSSGTGADAEVRRLSGTDAGAGAGAGAGTAAAAGKAVWLWGLESAGPAAWA
jgi:hypothetical protein